MYLPKTGQGHDVIVVGGSSGSFGVLRTLLKQLPADLPAALLIAVHIDRGVSLTKILGRAWPLTIGAAVSGERLSMGHVYLAVADAHLLIHDHHLLVRRGPRENRARPAVDALFRSAAAALGNRVIGVLLSGGLNDGVAGLDAIKRCGGIAVVQDPADAEVPSMPENALRSVAVDHTCSAEELPTLLRQLVSLPLSQQPPTPADVQLETAIAAQEISGMGVEDQLGLQAPFTCPECDGALWEVKDSSTLRFRCHVGHAATADVMLEHKSEAVEDTMWRLLRIHEERAALARKLSAIALAKGQGPQAADFEKRAIGYEEDASIVRDLIARVGAQVSQD